MPAQQMEAPPNYVYTSQPPNGNGFEYVQQQQPQPQMPQQLHQQQPQLHQQQLQQQQQPQQYQQIQQQQLQQQHQISMQQQNIEQQIQNVNVNIPTHSASPYLIPATSTRKKESVTIRVDDSTEMIRIQAQRIARLEERCDLLTKQYQRYVSSLEYKDQEINHWQERCNILQSHLETPYKRIEELQFEKNEVKRDQDRMQKVIKSGLEEYDSLEALRQQKLNDIKFWKERAKKAEKTQTIIMSLEHRIKMLQTENERLNQLIVKGSRYTPPVPAPVWQNN